jgi:hypothetical protein
MYNERRSRVSHLQSSAPSLKRNGQTKLSGLIVF